MGQDTATVDVDLILDLNIVTKDSDVLSTGPGADLRAPANNSLADVGVGLNNSVTHDDRAAQTSTVTDLAVRANDDTGTELSGGADLSRGVDEYVANVVLVVGELLRGALSEGVQEQTGTSKVVLGLADIHPVTLQIVGVESAALGELGEGLLLDGGGLEVDDVDDRGVKDINTSVDAVANESLGLLNETVDLGRVGLVNNDTVLAGVLDLSSDDGTLTTVSLVEVDEVLEGVVANNVRVQDEERRVVLLQDLLSELEGTGGAKGLLLDAERDVDTVLLLVLLKGLNHDLRTVVDSKHDISDASVSKSLDLVEDHGAVGELNQRLRSGKSKRTQTSTVASDKNQSLHFRILLSEC